MSQHFSPSPAPSFTLSTPDWNAINATEVTSVTAVSDTALALTTSDGELILTLHDFGLRLQSTVQRSFDYGLLVQQPTAQVLCLAPNAPQNKQTQIHSATQTLLINHQPFSFELFNKAGERVAHSADDGHFVRQHRVPPLAKVDGGWLVCMALASNEAIYGLGEKWGSLNKRGQLLRSYNVDALGVNAEVSYKNAPFCWSPAGWGQFVHTPAPVTHAVGHDSWSQRSLCTFIEDEVLDVFIFNSNNSAKKGAAIIHAYTELTGRAPMPPLWSAGVILSKAYYQDPEELLRVAHRVRAENMPCDTITIDGRAWQNTRTRFAFEWDARRWTNPKAVIDELKTLNFKVCVWEYPLISVEHPWFAEFAAKGWLLKDARTEQAYRYAWDRQAFGEVLTPLPDSGIVDFTHPDAYAFWRDAHQPLFAMGVDMIKADFGEQLEDNHMLAHNGERGHALHNVYAFLYNQCVFEAAQKYAPAGPFLFSRAAWSGSQRFNSQWGGDPQADWEGMMGNLRGGLSWGASGAPFYATDVGGFYKDQRDDALYVRWAQAAVFSAHFRLHGIGDREPWSYSNEACAAVMHALRLRYRLLPMLTTAMQQATETGLPVQRIMALAFADQPPAWSFENQFMFGEHLLVAPCFNPHGTVQVYLPNGQWARFAPDQAHDKQLFDGGQCHTLTLDLDQMAVFARVDTPITLGAAIMHCGELDAHAAKQPPTQTWIASQ